MSQLAATLFKFSRESGYTRLMPNKGKTGSYLLQTAAADNIKLTFIMACKPSCQKRTLLLHKENKLSKLNQTKEWLKDLHRQEPWNRELNAEKAAFVDGLIATTVAEAGLLVNEIARACALCRTLQ